MSRTYLVTGATGFVGSHIVEALTQRGDTVRAIVRAGSDTALLEKLGVQLYRGDLTDTDVLKQAADGVDVVIHAAAKVGDWGHVDEYRQVNVEGTRHLLDAVTGKSLHRFVHVSSLGVYEARHHYGTDETEPLPENHIDGYTQTKVESEKLALEYYRKNRVPVTVLRPGFIYGPRDRTVLPRLAQRLRDGDVIYIARGMNALNTTYVGNLVDAILLAIENPVAVGEAFNITDGEFVSKKRFFEAIADGIGARRPKRSIPLFLAKFIAKRVEGRYRRQNRPNPPRITQAIVKFAGLNLDYSIAKARTKLGYAPRVQFDEGMKAAIQWYNANRS